LPTAALLLVLLVVLAGSWYPAAGSFFGVAVALAECRLLSADCQFSLSLLPQPTADCRPLIAASSNHDDPPPDRHHSSSFAGET